MRRFQRNSRSVTCTVHIDILPLPQQGGEGGVDESDLAAAHFKNTVSSMRILSALQMMLETLFGMSAPRLESMAADAHKQTILIALHGCGQCDAVECLRAACAAVRSVAALNSPKQRVPVRLTFDSIR